INQDPEFTRAWIGLGRAHITNYWTYGGDPDDRQAAREAIDQARLLDSTEPELYMAEGFYWYWGHLDYERALYNLVKALELMPRNEEAHMWKGWVSRRAGFWDQAVASMEDSLRLNPRMHFHWVEYALTLLYLHRYDEARAALDKAQELNPNHFWTKDGYARLALQTGDIDSAIRYTTGAQHGDEFTFLESYMVSRLAADRFEEALETARNLNSDMEVQRQLIQLREMWTAQILHYMGREKESREAAQAALFRLQGLRKKLGDDYRLDHAEALISPLLGDTPEQVREKVNRAIASEPDDAVEHYRSKLQRAEIFALAGMAGEAIELLESLFPPPSETNVFVIEASPAFDGIRDLPEFIEMMEQHR
ncbi:MAG: tetratricopeptide repeat protein, partial [Xanthomonadales bacterium]|nr:tetratricopeptide repeat protein [Xanthomonadales bacterium]